MKKYNYEARDSASNKIVKSVVQAESENAAAKLLTTQGFVPLKIELQESYLVELPLKIKWCSLVS